MYQAGEAQSGNHQARPHATLGVEQAVVNFNRLFSSDCILRGFS